MKFDDILLTIGGFGRYQIWTYNLCCLFAFLTAFHLLVSVFLMGSSDHWCKIPEWDNVNCSEWGYNTSEECQLAKRDVAIPYTVSDDTGDVIFEKCERYQLSAEDEFFPDLNLTGHDVVPCDAGWVYDKSVFQSTVVQDFNLVCGLSYVTSVSQSLYFLGFLLGSLVFGHISDRFGRQLSLLSSLSTLCVSGTCLAFSPNIWVFTVLRFVVGAAIYGVLISSFVMGTELVGPSKRYFTGIAMNFYWAVGAIILAGIAYFIRNWRHLQLCVSLIPVAYFAIFPFLPESARWLIAKGRLKKAEKVLQKAAIMNKAKLPDPLFEESEALKESSATNEKEPTVLDLFRTPRLRMYTLNMAFIWIVSTLVYYGISLATESLGVNLYIAFFVSGAVEIPAYLSVLFGIELFGRRPIIVSYMLIAGVACLVSGFVPVGVARVTIAMIGKVGIAGSFAVVYLLPAEIFPTPIRSAGMGVCAMSSRVAGMICPLILHLAEYWGPAPFFIFGVSSVVAGVLAFFLPETKGRRVPETIEEGENFGKLLVETEKGADGVDLEERAAGTKTGDFKYQKAQEDDDVRT
ncbi:organic cation transporter protein-like [Diadema setosum]|uniref:organic cation transporter protein-like n=1 Tax=Diadema setosum TaxID=31175 RepID=UPI003B3BB305